MHLAHTDPDGPSDASLVARLREGQLSAIGALHRRYGQDVTSVLLRMAPQLALEDAEDLCQEVFLTFLDTLPRYEEQGRLRSWLYGIAARKARARQRRWWGRLSLRRQHGAAAAGVSLSHSRPEQQASARRQLAQALAELPDSQREVLVLHVIEGLPGAEVARALGISENAVRTRLHRARQTLAKLEESP
ncbi:MAG: sigma-70 family RNA polymerase sigma factor [Alphaproteobacteria bacterium]|nr:sigma-70 family RNA polymerase sigma factor [Alphaproteobacteria bacterium]MCB9792576.1 sigma-70 family RNA polymerase sigma factor [Alphaproteobacteria bacterium]